MMGKRSRWIQVRVSEGEWGRFEVGAVGARMNVSEYVRWRCIGELPDRKKTDRAEEHSFDRMSGR
jgi:hypothetical protein